MANLQNDISNKANGAASDFKSKTMSEGHQLEKMVQSAGERMGTMASDIAKTTTDSVKSSREYVIENPMKGVAIAAAAGLVAGSLLTVILRSRRD